MKRIMTIAILIASFAVAPAFGATSNGAAIHLINEGDALTDQFDTKGALELYRKAKATDPKSFDAAYKTVSAIINVGEDFLDDESDEAEKMYQEAVTLADQLVADYPDQALAFYYKALAYGKLAQSKGGKEKVRLSRGIHENAMKSIELGPDSFRPYLLLGVYHRGVAELSWILKAFANALFGGLPGGTLEESKSNLVKTIELNDKNVRSFYELALTYKAMDKAEKGIDLYESVLSLPATDHLDGYYKKKAAKKLKKLKKKYKR